MTKNNKLQVKICERETKLIFVKIFVNTKSNIRNKETNKYNFQYQLYSNFLTNRSLLCFFHFLNYFRPPNLPPPPNLPFGPPFPNLLNFLSLLSPPLFPFSLVLFASPSCSLFSFLKTLLFFFSGYLNPAINSWFSFLTVLNISLKSGLMYSTFFLIFLVLPLS